MEGYERYEKRGSEVCEKCWKGSKECICNCVAVAVAVAVAEVVAVCKRFVSRGNWEIGRGVWREKIEGARRLRVLE